VQYSKERYLEYKELIKKANKNRDFSFEGGISAEAGKVKKGSKPIRERTFLEKMVIFLLLAFLISIFMSIAFENTDIMIYDGIINFFVLGSVTAIRPQMVVEIMQKNNPRFDEIYGNKIKGLTLFIRFFGLFFIAMGVYFIYALIS